MPMSPDRHRGHSRGHSRGPPHPHGPPRNSNPSYKVLCVSTLHPKASDDVIRDTLYREYKKYGDISVRVMHEPDERVAYVYFRNFEDAKDAKHSKSRIILFDKPAMVEPVYENRSNDYRAPRRSITPPPPMQQPMMHDSRYRSRSPGYDGGGGHHHRSNRDSYGGGGGGGRDDYHHSSHRDNYHHRDNYDRGHGRPSSSRPQYHDRGSRGHHDYNDHHHHHHNHHHHHGGGGGGGQHHHSKNSRYNKDNRPETNTIAGPNKKDKFPNYLNHIPPEDDPLATRTLFTGNLELNITEEEMKRIFGRYGTLVDIDIKRPPPGTGNAYAFIRYENLDQAHRAKLELSGQYIGKFQCKIGYGKVNATPKVWVGGCGNWTSVNLLEREFDRFGAIQKIDYRKGDPYAFIWYETIEAAQAAVQEMRGFPLGGPEHRLRMDFADIDPPPNSTSNDGGRRSGDNYRDDFHRGGGGGGGRGGSSGRGFHDRNNAGRGGRYSSGRDDWSSGGNKRQYDDQQRDSDRPSRMRRVGDSPDSRGHENMEEDGRRSGGLENSDDIISVSELTKRTSKVWDGGLILKNSLFPTKLHIIEGNTDIVDSLKDIESDKPHLKITQRLRLDEGKLDDVTKRMESSNHAVFLGVNTNVEMSHENTEIQSRPLRNLVSYLKQKDAAGVITLGGGGDGPGSGVLYCFPPCGFSLNLIRREIPNINDEGLKEDHLVIVVVSG